MRRHLLVIGKGPDPGKAGQGLVQALGRDKDAALDAKEVQVVAKHRAVVVALRGLGAVQDRVDLVWVGRLVAPALVAPALVAPALVAPGSVAQARVLTVSVLTVSVPQWAAPVILQDRHLAPTTGPDILRRHRNRWLRKPWSSTVIPTVNWIAKSSSP
jgi:hypothetical protein